MTDGRTHIRSTNRHKFSLIDLCGYVQICGLSFLVRVSGWSGRVEELGVRPWRSVEVENSGESLLAV